MHQIHKQSRTWPRGGKTARLCNSMCWEYHSLTIAIRCWINNVKGSLTAQSHHKKRDIQCITHHSESVFNFSTGSDTWWGETDSEAQRQPEETWIAALPMNLLGEDAIKVSHANYKRPWLTGGLSLWSRKNESPWKTMLYGEFENSFRSSASKAEDSFWHNKAHHSEMNPLWIQ